MNDIFDELFAEFYENIELGALNECRGMQILQY